MSPHPTAAVRVHRSPSGLRRLNKPILPRADPDAPGAGASLLTAPGDSQLFTGTGISFSPSTSNPVFAPQSTTADATSSSPTADAATKSNNFLSWPAVTAICTAVGGVLIFALVFTFIIYRARRNAVNRGGRIDAGGRTLGRSLSEKTQSSNRTGRAEASPRQSTPAPWEGFGTPGAAIEARPAPRNSQWTVGSGEAVRFGTGIPMGWEDSLPPPPLTPRTTHRQRSESMQRSLDSTRPPFSFHRSSLHPPNPSFRSHKPHSSVASSTPSGHKNRWSKWFGSDAGTDTPRNRASYATTAAWTDTDGVGEREVPPPMPPPEARLKQVKADMVVRTAGEEWSFPPRKVDVMEKDPFAG